MSRVLLAPNVTQQIGRTKNRVQQLERRLAKRGADPTGYIAKWCLHGLLYVVESAVEVHPAGGQLQVVYAVLREAGSTATELSFRKNGVEFATMTLPAGRLYREANVNLQCGPRTDALTVAVTTAGADANSLTVYGLFDR